MNTVSQALEDHDDVVSAWREDVARRLEASPQALSVDRESQMDVRRRAAGLRRAESAVQACLIRRARGFTAARSGPTAVVVHRDTWMRDRICALLAESGIEVVGTGDDGAEALAMTLVEQPELLVLEGRLPWVQPVDVVLDVRRFLPRTVVAVIVEDGETADEMRAADATLVAGRTTPVTELRDRLVDALCAPAELDRSA